MSDSIDPQDRSTENMEWRIAQPVSQVLDFTQHMCQAITSGDWAEVQYWATRIASGTEEIAEAAGEATVVGRPRCAAVIEMIHGWYRQADMFHYAGHTRTVKV